VVAAVTISQSKDDNNASKDMNIRRMKALCKTRTVRQKHHSKGSLYTHTVALDGRPPSSRSEVYLGEPGTDLRT
jgi:hypothetical protein